MRSLVKGFDLLVAGVLTMMVAFAFELTTHLAIACSYCNGTWFAIATAIYNVVAVICILACFTLACVAIVDFFASLVRHNATCAVANLILLGTAVLVTRGDMFFFIMRGGAI